MASDVRSEAGLFEALGLLESERLDDDVRFVDWPRIEFTIRGEDFDGAVCERS